MIIAALILLGLCFGSFTNAFVWRLHEQEKPKKKRIASDKDLSISTGRSMCVNCKHTLGVLDLLPVFSWLLLRGKCRYCKQAISWQYPAVELLTAALFVISYVFWPVNLEGIEWAQFASWLVLLVGFMSLVVYDIRWMLLPNRIVFPLYGMAALIVVLEIASQDSISVLVDTILAIGVGGGIFYVLFQISKGKWIGGGDVKLGFLLGAVLGIPLHAALALFIASLLGTLVTTPLMALGKLKKSTRIPFGPFLIMATIIVYLFGLQIIDWYIGLFIDI